MTVRRSASAALVMLLIASWHVVPGAKAGSRTVAAGQSTSSHEADVAVPMRDGAVLRADVLRPSSEGRFPTLVYRP